MPKDQIAPPRLSVSLGQASEAGRKAENQDFHGALLAEGKALALKGMVFAVADGISSSAVSRQAAETAVAALMSDYYATPDGWSLQRSAQAVIAAANAWLHGRNAGFSQIDRGMVCTLSALILRGREGHVFHVGDSRVARLRGARLEALTRDHRVALAEGESFLARAMGAGASVEIDHARVALRAGDVFLLTTDGAHEHLDGPTVAELIAQAPDLDAAAAAMLARALARGADDNLTVQVLRIETLPEPETGAEALAPLTLPVAAPPAAGEVLDGFRILRRLHVSARSQVWLAQGADGAFAALKFASAEQAQDRAWLRRFAMEEWVARRLASPHLLRAAAGQGARSGLYVAMEHVEGRSLRQWMTDHPQATPDQARDIAGQLVAGLRALHRRGMIHQDLRPENVIIDEAGTVRIIDYGLVAVEGVEEAAPGLLGAAPGTFQYTAPEYLSGDGVSWRSDQFALAVIVYEMLTGRLPYGAQGARVASRRDQARLVWRPAAEAGNGVPRWIDAALRRAAHPDPARRYPALSEFLADLQRPGAQARAEAHVPLIARDPARFWQVLSVLLAILCIALAAGSGG